MSKRLVLALPAIAMLAWLAYGLLSWGVFHAVFRADAPACQALAHSGACWGVISEKARPILLGHYPFDEQWRPALMLLSFLALIALGYWAGLKRALSLIGLAIWLSWLLLSLVLMGGGVAGLSPVPSDQWGGLPLTLMLACLSWLASLPLAMVLAVGRRSGRSAISWLCTAYIEFVRGVPVITLLFLAAFLLPALLPQSWQMPLMWRAAVALTAFSAAYMAEIIRAGLQTVPAEQSEAAAVLGLSFWSTQWRIVWPQALRAVLPALVSHAIGLLKDTSLVMVISLHELTGGLSLSLGGDPQWRPFYLEAYLFVAAVYAAMCLALATLGRRVESSWVHAKH